MSLAELLLTACVALLVFGPSKLPMLARHLGWAVKKLNALKEQCSELWQQQLKEVQLLENTEKAKKADQHYQIKEDVPDSHSDSKEP